MEEFQPLLSLEKHCFFIGPQSPDAVYKTPDTLPFHLGVHPRYAIPRLLINREISSALDFAYSLGSMASTPLGESTLAINRMDEMIDGLVARLEKDIRKCNCLEIGAGSGGLMSALLKRGAQVTGVEIGPQGRLAAERRGLRIVDHPFLPGLFNKQFDLIYSYGCMEHLIDLDAFFSACRASLKEGGLMFHVVPNSTLFFEAGYLGHLAHEHVNYFGAINGIRLFESQGFIEAGAGLFRSGNELMLWGKLNSSGQFHWPSEAVEFEAIMLKDYAKRLNRRMLCVQHNLEKLFASGSSVGFYAGGWEYGFRMEGCKIRYFDGDTYKHGLTWLAGLPPIEAPEALLHDPVDHLVVFKPHYFEAIANDLRAMGVGKTRFWNLASLDDDEWVVAR